MSTTSRVVDQKQRRYRTCEGEKGQRKKQETERGRDKEKERGKQKQI